jgi:hypothetical protein
MEVIIDQEEGIPHYSSAFPHHVWASSISLASWPDRGEEMPASSGWANYMSSRYRLRLTNDVVGKAATNICKQGASAWVKHATVRMLQINNALIGHFPQIPTASPIFYDSVSHFPSLKQNPPSLIKRHLSSKGQTTPHSFMYVGTFSAA